MGVCPFARERELFMGKIYVRVDDRLIHGQIVTAWSQTLGIKEIIAIDDALVNNAMLQSIVLMAVPKQFGAKIVSAAEAAKLLAEDVPHNRLLITRHCRNLAEVKDAVMRATSINLGNISKQDGANHIFPAPGGCSLSLTQEDFDVIDSFAKAGIEVISSRMPNEKAKTWEEMTRSK